eukprot:7082290-Prymnesium_polylepis.2
MLTPAFGSSSKPIVLEINCDWESRGASESHTRNACRACKSLPTAKERTRSSSGGPLENF